MSFPKNKNTEEFHAKLGLRARHQGPNMNMHTLSDLFIGLTHEFFVDVTASKVNDFFAVSEDTNPLHHDASFAKSLGFHGNPIFGFLTASFYSTLIGVYLPGKNALILSAAIKFQEPVFSGDRLCIKGTIESVHEAVRVAVIAASITNQLGRVVSTARIDVRVHG